ncbi:hypothetical protein ACMBCN_02040 [Candidatus Liberibacter asiaticus]
MVISFCFSILPIKGLLVTFKNTICSMKTLASSSFLLLLILLS